MNVVPSLVYPDSKEPTQLHARFAAKQEATYAAMAALTTASHAVELLRGLRDYGEENLPVCVNHDAPICADYIDAMVKRMAISLRNGGRIR